MSKVVETAEPDADTRVPVGTRHSLPSVSDYRRSTLADHELRDSGVTFKAQAISIPRSASPTADVIYLRMNFRNSVWRHGRGTF